MFYQLNNWLGILLLYSFGLYDGVDYNGTLIVIEILKCGSCGYNAVSIDFIVWQQKEKFTCLSTQDTSSLRLIRVARGGLQIIKCFSQTTKLSRLEEGL